MSTHQINVNESKAQEEPLALQSQGPTKIHHRSRRWFYTGAVMLLVVVAVLGASPKITEEIAYVRAMQGYVYGVPWNWTAVVRVSFNSLWSFAFIDLQREPVIATFPNTKETPSAFRILNFWTDVIGTGGSRTPEANAGHYLIIGPGWTGAPPPNIKKAFQCSTRYAVFIEMAAASPQDFPKIHPLQDQLKITPLGAWRHGPRGKPI